MLSRRFAGLLAASATRCRLAVAVNRRSHQLLCTGASPSTPQQPHQAAAAEVEFEDDLDPAMLSPDAAATQRYPSHRPLDCAQRALLAVGSGLTCLVAPWRDDAIATFGETTGAGALRRMRGRMLADPTGRRILAERPRIRSATVDLAALRQLPPASLGRAYADFLDRYGYSPDARRSVSFVDEPELAYVMQRYREVHDLNHVLLGQGTDFLGEVVVKWFEAFQTGLPLCVTGALLGSVRLRPKQTQRYLASHLAYALRTGSEAGLTINYYFEQNWHLPLVDVRRALTIEEPPSLA